MGDENLEERTVVVLHIPDTVEDELLRLYFESRRSGGGELSSVDRNGGRALIVFKTAEVAARVLSKESHTLSQRKLIVCKKTPMDKSSFLLRGLSPTTGRDLLALYVENLFRLDPENYALHLSPGKDLVLIHLHQPPNEGFQKMLEKISKRTLEGATLSLEQVEHTSSILVENLPSSVTEDLLVLYFENSCSGGGEVVEVNWVSPGQAKVMFKDVESVDGVLQKPHRLEETDLIVKPFYSFLQASASPASLQNGTHQLLDDKSKTDDLVIGESSGSSDVTEIQEALTQKSQLLSSAEVSVPQQLLAIAPIPTKVTLPDPGLSTCQILITDPAKLELLSHSGLLESFRQNHPNCAVTLLEDSIRVEAPEAEKLKSELLEFLSCFSTTHQSLSPLNAKLLQRCHIRDRLMLVLRDQGTACTYCIKEGDLIVTAVSLQKAQQACRDIMLQLSELVLPVEPKFECMIYSEEWRTFLVTKDSCCTQVSDDGQSITVATLSEKEEEVKESIIQFLSTPVQKEIILSMEPAMLTYLQLHQQQLLVDMGEVVIYPLDTGDGLNIQGNVVECQNAAEVLSAVMSSTETKIITVNQPGISRFLRQDEGTSILGEMTAKFQVYISLEKVHWEPLEEQDIFELAWKMTLSQNFRRTSTSSLASADSKDTTAYIQEAKRILSFMTSSEPSSLTTTATEEEEEEDLYSEASASQHETENKILGLDEDAQLSLAIQLSMETHQNPAADDELQRLLLLSKTEVLEDNESKMLEKAIDMSLKEAIRSANVAQIKVFASYPHDLVRVDIALGKKVGQRQHEEKLEHKCFLKLSSFHQRCVDLIRRKHAVDIQIEGTTAIVSGFKDYITEALPDLNMLMKEVADAVDDDQIQRTIQWVWQREGEAATPYSTEATVLIENAWKMKQKKIDVLFDNQPYTIDFAKMQEYSVSSGRTASISRRTISPLDMYNDFPDNSSRRSDMPEIKRIAEGSEEYDAVIGEFKQSIQDKKINIIKVEKLMNHLLYNQYDLKKEDMEQKCQSQVERTLYHGTSERSVREICIHGFNRSFCGKNATVYGQGVYFAVQSSYSFSDTYSPPNADGHKFIFVAKVLSGDYTTGRSDMKAAPLKEGSDSTKPMRYHSVVDQMDDPSLFVIFNDTQAFPQYLITCQKL